MSRMIFLAVIPAKAGIYRPPRAGKDSLLLFITALPISPLFIRGIQGDFWIPFFNGMV
jgi:hypothetical protein